MFKLLWTDGDCILKHSLLYAAIRIEKRFDMKTICAFLDMEYLCKLDSFFSQRKSPNYRWSNSGSENPAENTLFKRPTWWIYHKILKHLGWDPYKGANFDQLRAYWLTLYINKRRFRALKHLVGFILRLGFAPSMMEHVFFKPQATVCLLATIWEPLKYLVWIPFKASCEKNLSVPVMESTTNKITLIPTMMVLCPKEFDRIIKSKFTTRNDYISLVYSTYFNQMDNKIVGNYMIRALKHERHEKRN